MPTVYLNPDELQEALTAVGLKGASTNVRRACTALETAMQKGYDALIDRLGVTPLSSFVYGWEGAEPPFVCVEWAHADAIPYELLAYRAEEFEFADNDPDSMSDDLEVFD